MCGRYYIEISDAALKEIAEEIMRKMAGNPLSEQLSFKFDGEIFPTNIVPVQTAAQGFLPMRWGFTGFRSSGTGSQPSRAARPIINARSETVLEKATFRQPVLERRCLIPASGYYEWRQEQAGKQKYRIFAADGPIYFAGCWRSEKEPLGMVEIPRFVILTQAAAPGIEHIHDRMPVMFDSSQAQSWLDEGMSAVDGSLRELSFAVA